MNSFETGGRPSGSQNGCSKNSISRLMTEALMGESLTPAQATQQELISPVDLAALGIPCPAPQAPALPQPLPAGERSGSGLLHRIESRNTSAVARKTLAVQPAKPQQPGRENTLFDVPSPIRGIDAKRPQVDIPPYIEAAMNDPEHPRQPLVVLADKKSENGGVRVFDAPAGPQTLFPVILLTKEEVAYYRTPKRMKGETFDEKGRLRSYELIDAEPLLWVEMERVIHGTKRKVYMPVKKIDWVNGQAFVDTRAAKDEYVVEQQGDRQPQLMRKQKGALVPVLPEGGRIVSVEPQTYSIHQVRAFQGKWLEGHKDTWVDLPKAKPTEYKYPDIFALTGRGGVSAFTEDNYLEKERFAASRRPVPTRPTIEYHGPVAVSEWTARNMGSLWDGDHNKTRVKLAFPINPADVYEAFKKELEEPTILPKDNNL